MTKKEITQTLSDNGFTYEEVRRLYDSLIKKAKAKFREDCIMNVGEVEAPYLMVQIGICEDNELIGRVRWQYGYMTGDTPKWFYAATISLTEQQLYPICAGDYLYENTYYQRTGHISQKSKDLAWNQYKSEIDDSFLSFDRVVAELIDRLD